MNVSWVFGRAREPLGALPDDMRALADGVIGRAQVVAARYPEWPLLALPEAFLTAYGVPDDRARALLAGAALLYAAADVIDDAQDGDLAPAEWGEPPWIRAVNVGNALAFGAVEAFQAAAAPGQEAAMARAVARAGLAMAAGQHLDFALGPGGASASEMDYLAGIEGKSGGSLGLFCRASGLAAGRPDGECDLLEEVGRCAGAAIQIRSDMAEIWSAPPSRDLARGQRTLPVLVALAQADAPGKERLAAFAADPDRKPDLVAALDAAGAGPFCDLRLEGYSRRAIAALARLDLPEDTHAALQDRVADLALPPGRTPI